MSASEAASTEKLWQAGDLVRIEGVPQNGVGVVCRTLEDGSVQAFFAEGPAIDEYAMDSYPADWLEAAS